MFIMVKYYLKDQHIPKTLYSILKTNTGNNKAPVNLFGTLNNIILGYFDVCSGLKLNGSGGDLIDASAKGRSPVG